MNLQGKNVIVIGDSHTDLFPFGPALVEGLTARGASVTTAAIGGKAAVNFIGKKQPVCRKAAMGQPAKCANLNDLAGRRFDVAIVVLGTNDAANMNREAIETGKSRSALMEKAIRQITAAGGKVAPKMVWVGPPRVTGKIKWYTQDAMDALYSAGLPVFGSSAIDSRQLMPAKYDGDGVHLGKTGNRVWADGVLARLDAMGEMLVTTSTGASDADQEPGSSAPLELASGPNFAVLLVAAAIVFFLLPRRSAFRRYA